MLVGAEVDDVAAPRLSLSINAVNGITAIRTTSHPHIIPTVIFLIQILPAFITSPVGQPIIKPDTT